MGSPGRPGRFRVGDWLVYTKQKSSASPGPRAEAVSGAEHGDLYSYTVDKYWTVAEIVDDNELIVRTRRGKTHRIAANAPGVRRPNLWERLFRRNWFPSLSDPLPDEPAPKRRD